MSSLLERLQELVGSREDRDDYEPLRNGEGEGEESVETEVGRENRKLMRFSWVDYGIFMLLGISMLWSWNMFLAAGPYFQRRFQTNKSILQSFQSSELAVSTVANLGTISVLTKLQAKANYPRRINTALFIYVVTFTFLAISTRIFLNISAGGYFGFILVTIWASSMATGFFQNGIFAYMSGLGREEYMQANMTGQAIAGVLPCIVQIVSVLAVPERRPQADDVPQESSKSAFAYFMTATGVSVLTLIAFFILMARHRTNGSRKRPMAVVDPGESIPQLVEREEIPLMLLFRKLFWLASAVFLTFALSMFFPVYTQQILSVRPVDSSLRIFQPSAFIPLALLFWNSGDLIGRLACSLPRLSLGAYPRLLFLLAIARVVFIPMYQLCNIGGRGAVVSSDTFYLLVQILFGFSNGFIGSQCMMVFVDYVDTHEREAAGAFMSTVLVFGLAAGSFASFLVSTAV
ncbi:hypothetical protein EJ05DRAFT_472352 [Pseudovirgaria hyperparasitica]|uniref:Nucleoside transporter family n=1 Tax=Pseudovirgaria hyperparasitica TaxID=470096 RepID=A0A6A6WN30_9PEZI|nr:uncharacterized protein EJ05DRAFT_472352 [Pseudovirgaria hyperparasitica]KAF2763449.1 hypothetical protein EJ05DRAFT_472352 [Pseudovirgaria hyperparasitica]